VDPEEVEAAVEVAEVADTSRTPDAMRQALRKLSDHFYKLVIFIYQKIHSK